MKRVTIVVGTRPNFVKAASLYAALKAEPEFTIRLVHTGQHYDYNMADIFFRELRLPVPDVNLGVGSGTQTWQIAHTMLALEEELKHHGPSLLVTVGDVNSTLAACLVGSKLHLRMAHVEAGLRSYDRRMSEETNRIVADALSDLLFTTSSDADANLIAEGVPACRIFCVGNVMVDTLLTFQASARAMSAWEQYGLSEGKYGVVTLHRAEAVDDPNTLIGMLDALQEISRQLPLIFPVHPRTKLSIQTLAKGLDAGSGADLRLVEPMGYLSFIGLMAGSRVVLSDSGGIQAETTMLSIPCLTLRDNTEYTITLTHGTNQLVGTKREAILAAFDRVMSNQVSQQTPPLWDGKAAHRIVDILKQLD